MLWTSGLNAIDVRALPKAKTAYALRALDRIVRRASELGPNVEAFAMKLLEGPLPWAKLRAGQKLVSLGERYGGERLDAACRRSLTYDLVDVRRVPRILLQALDHETPVEEEAGTPLGSRFARPGSAFDHHQPAVQETTG